MFLLGVIILLALAYLTKLWFYFRKQNHYWKEKNVSFEKPKLLFGNILDIALGKDSLGKYLEKLYKKFNTPYFGIFILNKPVLVVKDPKLLKHILVKDFQFFTDKNFYIDEKIDPIFSKSVISAPFKTWKSLRPQLTKMFTSGKINAMLEFIKKSAESLVGYLETKVNKNFIAYEVIGNFVADATAASLFGIDLKCFDRNNPIKHHCFQLLPKSGYESAKIYCYNFIHSAVRLFRFRFFNSASTKFLQKVFVDLITERKLAKSKRHDLIDLLIELKDKEDSKVSDEQVLVSQALSFIVAGQDTTNLITSFVLYEICKSFKIQDRLRMEINEVLQHHHHISYEAINEMKYLDMVVSETLRKYPIVNFLQRKCVADYVVPGTGLKIESNTSILIPIHGLHFDPKYFPDPEKFDPERFNNVNRHKIDPYTYLPFGMGPRNCIGIIYFCIYSKLRPCS